MTPSELQAELIQAREEIARLTHELVSTQREVDEWRECALIECRKADEARQQVLSLRRSLAARTARPS